MAILKSEDLYHWIKIMKFNKLSLRGDTEVWGLVSLIKNYEVSMLSLRGNYNFNRNTTDAKLGRVKPSISKLNKPYLCELIKTGTGSKNDEWPSVYIFNDPLKSQIGLKALWMECNYVVPELNTYWGYLLPIKNGSKSPFYYSYLKQHSI